MTKHNNQAAPRLRFQGFDGAWEERELGDIAEISSGGTPNRKEPLYWNGTIPWVTTSEVDNCLIQTTKEFITQLGLNNSAAKIFPKNTILMAMYGQGKTRGKVGILNIEATTNQACASIILDKQYSYEFIYQALASQYEDIRLLSNSGGQDNLSKALIKNILFRLPEKDEQTQLGNFFRQLDERIAQSRALWEKSRQLKKAMLAKMFPAAGETAPQIRFKGFTGAWERKKLGEIADFAKGKGLSKASIDNNGKNHCILYGELYTKYGCYVDKIISSTSEKINNPTLSKSNDVLMPTSDVTPNGLAKACAIFLDDIVLGGDILVIRSVEMSGLFFAYFIESNPSIIIEKTTGTTVFHIYAKDMSEIILPLPSPEEQTAIGNFFRQLDDTIALQALETEKLGYLKKALLAAMLV